ncbi:hypothetical protein SAY86_018675 [Trapa natans]|uniref:Uncharacterized protein n=1 Tax=Trapa natans TaxID=22666 RepID=A0AAN7QZ20_TRANT|nr:hypothetical protein SAY86_018675 [Trapa natans]
MLLLTAVVEASRQQLQVYTMNQGKRPVLHEFTPLKPTPSHISEKKSWMASAQLWSQGPSDGTEQQSFSQKESGPFFNINPKLTNKP